MLTAASGAEALALLEAEPVQVVLSERRVPPGDAVDLVDRIGRDHAQRVRLVLTGYDDERAVRAAIDSGLALHFYFARPWRGPDVRLVVARALRDLGQGLA